MGVILCEFESRPPHSKIKRKFRKKFPLFHIDPKPRDVLSEEPKLVLHFNNQTALSLFQIRPMVIAYSLAIGFNSSHTTLDCVFFSLSTFTISLSGVNSKTIKKRKTLHKKRKICNMLFENLLTKSIFAGRRGHRFFKRVHSAM